MRTLFTLLLLLAPVALAAPVPKETEKQKIERLYGKVMDPKGDSKFSLDGDKLTVTLPAKEVRSFDYVGERLTDPKTWKKSSTAPRVDFTASGDFQVTVRATLALDPKAEDIRSGHDEAFVGGGIQLQHGESNWYYLGPAESKSEGKAHRHHSFESPGAYSKGLGLGIGSEEVKAVANPSWVRLTRADKGIVFAVSTDGKEFVPLLKHAGAVPDETVHLSLSAHHCSDTAHAVMFDEFKVEAVRK